MSDAPRTKALVVAADEQLLTQTAEALASDGWDVVCKTAASEALLALETSRSSPFVLMVSGYRIPKTDGHSLLKTAERLSPRTQRMLIVPADEAELLIQAINAATIHACMSFPFNQEDLLYQARTCHTRYQEALKREQFKRLIKRQNRQLYETAQSLKKKEGLNKRLLGKKRMTLSRLKSQGLSRNPSQGAEPGITLSRMLDSLCIPGTPGAFFNQFMSINRSLTEVLKAIAAIHESSWSPPALETIYSTSADNADPARFLLLSSLSQCLYASQLPQELPAEILQGGEATIRSQQTIEDYLELSVSDSQTQAWLKKRTALDTNVVNLRSVLNFLKDSEINYGIVDDTIIEHWISTTGAKEKALLIAEGDAPVPGRDGSIDYQFQTDYINPGKIREDGSIDFRERGEVPFVRKFALIAVKKPARKGTPGISVYGAELPVDDIVDPPFLPGAGTVLSDDGLSILADLDGQPHVDAKGTITVNEEIELKGDVDFKTGNVSFNGNVVVRGTVKEGFSVKCISLTANAIEGATLDLTGDLNVSNGITNTTIHAVGNIQTKFINHCHILGFGNFTVLKEIIDSRIYLSGSCLVPTGSIIASTVSAMKGIEAKRIGTQSSSPPVLRVGLDDHIGILKRRLCEAIDKSQAMTAELTQRKKRLKARDIQLHQSISENAHIQDRSQVALKDHRKQILAFEHSGSKTDLKELTDAVSELTRKAAWAEAEINRLFAEQDTLGMEMEQVSDQIHASEDQTLAHEKQLRDLDDFLVEQTPVPQVKVNAGIIQGTSITGPKSSLTLNEDRGKCTIREIKKDEDGFGFTEMAILD